jgi:Helicase conserved C-terminal domain
MPLSKTDLWAERIRQILGHYEEPLLRRVAGKLFKPRSQWPASELIERAINTLTNAAVIDRRLDSLDVCARKLLTLLGHSRQARWKLGHLLELLASLGNCDGMRPAFILFEEGLLYPDVVENGQLKSFEHWLQQAAAVNYAVVAHPFVAERAIAQDLGLPELPGGEEAAGIREADGLDWPLRLGALWQQVAASPLRQTQQGELFKRDWERLRSDPVVNGSGETIVEIPDPGQLALALAKIEGFVQERDGELRAGLPPGTWAEGLPATLESLWGALLQVEDWDPSDGARGPERSGNPYPSASLLAVLLLTRLPESQWARPAAVEDWIVQHHPFWEAARAPVKKRANAASAPGPVALFLLGLAYPLRLVQIGRSPQGEDLVRLSPLGRWLLGVAESPPDPVSYPKTILVQPNLEIVVYRQGLTPGLIASLSTFAAWKSLGSVCTLQLEPETVYRALEAGWTFESILQTLEQYGMHPTPPAVVESLRTWANKRDRLTIYPSAALFEFGESAELDEALARGLPAVRLTERLAVVHDESAVDFRHFRLNGTRDYGLPPDQCVEVEDDGVTLTIDPARADLLLETELRRFAERCERLGPNGRRQYRVTPASLATAQDGAMQLQALEEWFRQRTGRPPTPAVKLLMGGDRLPAAEMRQELVLHVASPEVADGLLQWPGTRGLFRARLGPTALSISRQGVAGLRERLAALGISLRDGISETDA